MGKQILGAGLFSVLVIASAPAPAAAQPSGAPEGQYACTVAEIGVFSNRVHVRCTVGLVSSGAPGAKPYFATEANGALAQQLVTLAGLARAANKTITLGYRFGSPPAGCLPIDCVRVVEARLGY